MSDPPTLQSDSMMMAFESAEKKVDPIGLCWERILKMQTKEVCETTGAREFGDRVISLRFINREVFCWIEERCLKYLDGTPINDLQTNLILLLYLQSKPPNFSCEEPDISNQNLVSAFQLPNGDVFFRGPHIITTAPLEKLFGQTPKGFLNAGKRLGGNLLEKGDASFRLRVLPYIEMCFVLYAADEEFPARVSIIFSESINHYLPLDGIWALSNVVVKQILE